MVIFRSSYEAQDFISIWYIIISDYQMSRLTMSIERPLRVTKQHHHDTVTSF